MYMRICITYLILQNIHDILIRGGEGHTELMEELRDKSLQISTELSDNANVQKEDSFNWNDKTTMQLHSMQERIEKFLLEDLRRDTPTGK